MALVGEVYFRPDFAFPDGGVADKLLVILAHANGCYVVAKTTSQEYSRQFVAGCQGMGEDFHSFHIPLGSGSFNTDTWICLDEYYELLAPGIRCEYSWPNVHATLFHGLFAQSSVARWKASETM